MGTWYKMDPTDWDAGTNVLTLEQEAAYLRICHAIYATERPVPNNPFVIAGLFRCNDRKAKRLLSELVEAGKITIEDGLISNRRAVEEVSNRARLRVERESAGRRGGVESANMRAKSLKNNDQAQAIASSKIQPEKSREEKRRDTASAVSSATPAQAPDRFDALLDKLLAAAGIKGNPHPGLIVVATIMGLMDAGYDLDTDILPVIRSKAATMASPPRSWGYFEQPIRDAKAKRSQIASIPKPVEVEADWPGRVAAFRKSGTWANAWGPRPGQAGCMAPAELLERAA